jgi:hypothetical protein
VAAAEHASGEAQQHPDLKLARKYFYESYQLKANPIAARCLAVSGNNATEAGIKFEEAWLLAALPPQADWMLLVALANEISGFYLQQIAEGTVLFSILFTLTTSLTNTGPNPFL